MRLRTGLIIALLLLSIEAHAGAAKHGADIAGITADDASGEVFIRYLDGRTVQAPRAYNQASLSRPAVAPDRRTIGWLGNYRSCCQSYPIPRQLVIWRAGSVIRRINAQAMIWDWRFYRGGRQVAFSDGPTHGSNLPYNYKLFDVLSGRRLSEIDAHAVALPGWARLLLQEQGK